MADEDKKQTPPEVQLMDIDIDGITVKVPVDQGKKMIEKRQEKHQLFKEISDKAKKYEQDLAEQKRLSDAKEAALNGKLAEAELLFSKKSDEKLANIQNHLINKEIESVLLSDDSFMKESKEDAIKLLKADITFKMSDDGTQILAGDKPAKEVISEWMKSKTIFKKATGVTPTGAKPGPNNKKTNAPAYNFADALAKTLNK